ncbi:MAG: metal-dependent hydrolase [Planctomycetaceae bacterium]
MPGFRAHITGSSIAGAGYAAAAWYAGGLPPETCALGGGLCAVAGMLPDLDSGPGVPLRESVAFTAAVVPMMMVPRLAQAGLPMEAIILVGAAIYLAIRFGLDWLLKNHAHHRGMFHSLPAAAIAGQVTFLAFAGEEPLRRYFVSSAVVLGFLTHLVLDEIWSVKMGWFGPKVKKSFGTALKFHGPDLWPNLITYALTLILGGLAAGDAAWTEKLAHVRQQQRMEQAARTFPYQQPQSQTWQFRR